MATELSKPVAREVVTDHGTMIVVLDKDGVTLRKKGTRRNVKLSWAEALQSGALPESAPKKAENDAEARTNWFYR